MSLTKDWTELEEKLKKELVRYRISDCGEFGIFQTLIYKGAPGNTEWWTDNDWDMHNERVRELIKNDEYLKPEIITVIIKRTPEDYGELVSIADTKESYSFGIIDLLKLSEKL